VQKNFSAVIHHMGYKFSQMATKLKKCVSDLVFEVNNIT